MIAVVMTQPLPSRFGLSSGARDAPPLHASLVRAMGVAAAYAALTALSAPMIWLAKFGVAAIGGAAIAFAAVALLSFLDAAAMMAVLVIGQRRLPAKGRARIVGMVWLVLAVAGAGLLVVAVTQGIRNNGLPFVAGFQGAYEIQEHLTIAMLSMLAFDYMLRSRAANDAAHATQLHSLALERELAGAHLQLLQAQVEPHFLFNTLANLRRLVRTDRGAARAMLGDLMRYLEVALPRLRDERSTLARELALVQAYLAVHQVRMGARLRTEFDVPDPLGGREVPPMVLLTLVENALKHGVQPLVDGALVRVSAAATEGRLTLTVADTGRGMVSGSGSGSGLANLRARLKALYGNVASLTLQVNEPQGLVATVVLPETSA